MDYGKVVKSIKDMMKKSGHPLSEDQEALMAGGIAFFLDQAHEDGRACQALIELKGRDRFLEELKNG